MASLAARLRRSLRPPRRLRFTRQGRWFTGMTFLVGFGAINTGNNLLYLLLGMMLGLILVSGIMSEAMLRRLHVDRLSAAPLYAGQPGALEYRLANGKRRFPSFSIEVRELETPPTRERRLGERSSRQRRPKRKRLRELLGQTEAPAVPVADWLDPGVPRCYVHRVPARGAVVRTGHVTLPRRGLYRYRGLALLTRFPFGFFEKSRELDTTFELLAYPRVLEPPPLELPNRRREGDETRLHAGHGFEYHGLRDYRDGEDWRRIHWKVSARRTALVVRENEQEHTHTLAIAVVHSAPDHPEGAAAVERAIEIAAALARERLAQGCAVALVTQDGALPLARGPAQLGRILRALALLEVHTGDAPARLRPVPAGVPSVLVAPVGSRVERARFTATLRVTAGGLAHDVEAAP